MSQGSTAERVSNVAFANVTLERRALTARKQQVRDDADRYAGERERWIRQNRQYHADDRTYFRFMIPPGLRVLDLGCGNGDLLAALEPALGVGVDLSPRMLEQARARHPGLTFLEGDVEDGAVLAEIEGPFDVIVLADTVGALEDIQTTVSQLHRLCTPETRLIVGYHSIAWQPFLRLGERTGLKMPDLPQNWLFTSDIANILSLAGFEIIRREWRQLLPWRFLGLGPLINRYIATLPGLRRLCLRNYVVARSLRQPAPTASGPLSATVLVPCRNERGNVEAAVKRLPRFCRDLEILFVEGHSSDGTLDEIHRVIAAYPDRDIRVLVQPGKGKGDAVHYGFSQAKGDVLIILDGDLTTPPEDIPKFYEAIASGRGEFINGTRLVYPMESEAMQPLNRIANEVLSWLLTWLLNGRYTDTLCGTKVLRRHHYRKIREGRAYFGDFDPFGDFDLILGAAKLNLKVVEIPIRYANRSYGSTQISRFSHGWLLLRMVGFAFRKLKAF